MTGLERRKGSKIVCFGASAAAHKALQTLTRIGMPPAFVCDNDPKKQGTLFHGYRVESPDALFTREKELFVIIASMYCSAISQQLERYPGVADSVFYLDVIPHDLALSSLNRQPELPDTVHPATAAITLLVRYDGAPGARDANLETARRYGIADFLDCDAADERETPQLLDYTSYGNRLVFDALEFPVLSLFETRYNFDALNYKRVLEYALFDRLQRPEPRPPLILSPWHLLQRPGFLEATAAALQTVSAPKLALAQATRTHRKTHPHALLWHLYHVDMFEAICDELGELVEEFDIHISINPDAPIGTLAAVRSRLPEARLYIFENRGRDILPFLNIFREILPLEYESICKIHTKHSIYRTDGKAWGAALRTGLFDAYDTVIRRFRDEKKIGAFAVSGNVAPVRDYLDANRDPIAFVCDKIGIAFSDTFTFPVGTMFWCRPEAIRQLADDALQSRYFMLEGGCIDGQIEHAVERVIGLLIAANGFTLEEV